MHVQIQYFRRNRNQNSKLEETLEIIGYHPLMQIKENIHLSDDSKLVIKI